MPFSSIAAIKRANKAAGQHYFDRDTVKFFNARVHGGVYGGHYFIESIQREPGEPRQYKIRKAADSGKITTAAGPFDTIAQAQRLMHGIANGVEGLVNPRLGTSFVRAKVRRLANGRIHLMILGTPRKQKRTVKRGSKRARAGSRR